MSHTIDGGGNANTFRDIHGEMDGKLYKYNLNTEYSIETKKRLIACLIKLVEERANPNIKPFGIQGLSIILNDSGQNPNYLHADKLYADDILAGICELLVDEKDEEVINTVVNHLCEQMSDMIRTNGYCPSGRCRVFSVYMFLRDYKEGKHIKTE